MNEATHQTCEQEYHFALVLDGVAALTQQIEDALFSAGCDDATLSIHCGQLYMEFTRSAKSLKYAIASAIDDVQKAGIDAADGSIFKGAPWVLTSADTVVTGLVEAVGAQPMVMDAETHDRLVAGVSHAAFLLSVGYVLSLSGRPDWADASKLAASGFRDMSRLAAGDPSLYAGIARTNRAHLLDQLDAISSALARLRRHLDADDPRLVELFEEARAVRERWARDNDSA